MSKLLLCAAMGVLLAFAAPARADGPLEAPQVLHVYQTREHQWMAPLGARGALVVQANGSARLSVEVLCPRGNRVAAARGNGLVQVDWPARWGQGYTIIVRSHGPVTCLYTLRVR